MARKDNPESYDYWTLGAAFLGAIVLTLFVRNGARLGPGSAPHDPTANQSPLSNELVGPEEGSPIDWPNARVLLIGDSLATPLGLGNPLRRSITERGGAFKNIAIGGTDTPHWAGSKADGAHALAEALQEFRPNLVLISLGTNDESKRSYNGDPRWWTKENLEKNVLGPNYSITKERAPSVDRLLAKLGGIHVVWIGPPAAHPDKWPMERAFREMLAEKARPYYFDTEVVAPEKSGDKVHCSPTGYRVWADSIMQYLERLRF